MKNHRTWMIYAAGLGSACLAFSILRPAAAQQPEMMMPPAVNFSAPYTRLLGAAPIKPPLLFADDTDAVAAKIEAVSWYNSGGASGASAAYRGYGGWYGPWAGFGGFGYFGSPYSGYWSGGYRPYGFFSPFGWAYPYYAGVQGQYPMFSGSAFPPNVSMGTVAFPPYSMEMSGRRGGLYW